MSIPSYYTLEEKEFHSIHEVESWGPSQLIAEWADLHHFIYSMPDWKVVREINSKRFSFENSPKLEGAALLTGASEAERWMHSFRGTKVLKKCFGVSGKGHLLIEESTPPDRVRQFLYDAWEKNLPVIAEPWVKRILDFSTQWFIEKNRHIIYLGSTICYNDRRGQYQYNEVGKENELFGPYFSYLLEHRKKIEPLLKAIATQGFFGNLGVDAMLYTLSDSPETIHLHPVVEINARKTMGWAALMVQRRYFSEKKIQFRYIKGNRGFLPNSLFLKNGEKISFARNLMIHVYN